MTDSTIRLPVDPGLVTVRRMETLLGDARPVWIAGRHEDMNLTAGFRCTVNAPAGGGRVELHLAMRSIYRLWLDGRCAGYGPARSAHGHVRVDAYAWDLPAGCHLIAIEAQAANVPAFAMLDEHPFVQAEVRVGGRVVAATGVSGWQALVPGQRVQRLPRMSRQRGFTEAWRLRPGDDDWRLRPDAVIAGTAVEAVAPAVLQPRRLPLPALDEASPVAVIAGGTASPGPEGPLFKWETWMRQDSGGPFAGFPRAEWEVDPSGEIASWPCRADPSFVPANVDEPLDLTAGTWRILDFGVNRVGFVRCRVECRQSAVLYLLGDEILDARGDVDGRRNEFFNGVRYELAPGTHDLLTFEIMTLRYLKFLALAGAVRVSAISLVAYERALPPARFSASDPRLDRLFATAARTFAHNTVDNFLDCPSRERAGWLCDSFFTGRSEPCLTGGLAGETLFLENYLLCPDLPDVPQGMLPRCYPADQSTMRRPPPGAISGYLPTWPMWLVLQIEEYLHRGGAPDLVEAFRPRVTALIGFLDRFLNADGLLERLEKWVFVDWSEANQHVQDVSFPGNLLYAACLDAAGRLYDRQDWRERAGTMRRRVQDLAWDGRFFCDNAIRAADGRLVRTGRHTEACQYYAFFFGAASPESHPGLWRELVERCSLAPGVVHPDLPRCGMFMGQHLRMMLLARHGHVRQLAHELIAGYLPMTESTGTFWEHELPSQSCDHGFASHVAHILITAICGLRVDWSARRLHLAVPDNGLDWCRVRLPLAGAMATIGWERTGTGIRPQAENLPEGWSVQW